MCVDFVLGGYQNRKRNSDFTEVQNPVLISISSVLEGLRMQYFTGFHKILHMAQKRGRLDAYCF